MGLEHKKSDRSHTSYGASHPQVLYFSLGVKCTISACDVIAGPTRQHVWRNVTSKMTRLDVYAPTALVIWGHGGVGTPPMHARFMQELIRYLNSTGMVCLLQKDALHHKCSLGDENLSSLLKRTAALSGLQLILLAGTSNTH